MKISVIIPTLNEADRIGDLIAHLKQSNQTNNIDEILVIDGGSHDDTCAMAEAAGGRVMTSAPGRAHQMNVGANFAVGQVLYFLHADTYPPPDFDACILDACSEGYHAGSFRHSFDDAHPILRLTSWIVNHVPRIRLGDQSLFVLKSAFEAVGGFDERLIIMEDADITIRLRQQFCFQIVDCTVITSARKFRENGELRLLLIFTLVYLLYELGLPQATLLGIYRALIRQNKI